MSGKHASSSLARPTIAPSANGAAAAAVVAAASATASSIHAHQSPHSLDAMVTPSDAVAMDTEPAAAASDQLPTAAATPVPLLVNIPASRLLQAGLPTPPDRPHFYAVSHGMMEQWTADIEELETALASPFAPSPTSVSGAQAQIVCDRLRAMWQELARAHAIGHFQIVVHYFDRKCA
jgi:hypothetical protein